MGAFEQITKMLCNSIVRHCQDWIDQFIASEAAEDLQQCGTLAGVIKHLSLLNATSEQIPPSESDALHTKIPPRPTSAAASVPAIARSLRCRHRGKANVQLSLMLHSGIETDASFVKNALDKP